MLKSQTLGRLGFGVSLGLGLIGNSFSWSETTTHVALTQHSLFWFLRYPQISPGWTYEVEMSHPQLSQGIRSVVESGTLIDHLTRGTIDEDSYAGLRFRHHFYDPLTNSGLSDGASGVNSLYWAYSHPDNEYSWVRARASQWQWLTGGSLAERNRGISDTHVALGHILHLIQDLSQPQHTRNDNHANEFSGGWGIEHYASSRYTTGQQVFSIGSRMPVAVTWRERSGYVNRRISSIPEEVQYFWDTEYYTPSYDGSLPPVAPYLHGLAEFSNFNFVTTDTMFTGEPTTQYLPSGRYVRFEALPPSEYSHIYRYPKFAETNAEQIIPNIPGGFRLRRTLSQQDSGSIFSLRWDSYEGWLKGWSTANLLRQSRSVVSPFDAVLGLSQYDYGRQCQALLPLAGDYGYMALLMFFRGRIGVWDSSMNGPMFELNAENITDAPPGKGGFAAGTWSLFQDQPSGNRFLVMSSDMPGELSLDEVFHLSFSPQPWVGPYTLVFRGKIGTEQDAIAARSFRLIPYGISASGDGIAVTMDVTDDYAWVDRVLGGGKSVRLSGAGEPQVSHDGARYNLRFPSGSYRYDDGAGNIKYASGTLHVGTVDSVRNTNGKLGADSVTFSFSGRDSNNQAVSYSTTVSGNMDGHVTQLCFMDSDPN